MQPATDLCMFHTTLNIPYLTLLWGVLMPSTEATLVGPVCIPEAPEG